MTDPNLTAGMQAHALVEAAIAAPHRPGHYELRFDYPRPPLSANDRMHWARRARLTKDVRTATRLLAARIGPLERVSVQLTWYVKDRRRRDGGENLAPTLKPMIDGLVDAGVVEDDDPTRVTRRPSIVVYVEGCIPHMTLTVTQITPEEIAA